MRQSNKYQASATSFLCVGLDFQMQHQHKSDTRHIVHANSNTSQLLGQCSISDVRKVGCQLPIQLASGKWQLTSQSGCQFSKYPQIYQIIMANTGELATGNWQPDANSI